MSPYTAFLIFAFLVIVELWAAHAWLPLYYRFGLPVSIHRVNLAAGMANIDSLKAFFASSDGPRAGHPSLEFRALPGSPAETLDIALRERMFENRPGLKYLPVMHAVARLRPAEHSAVVTGSLNLSTIYALGYAIYRAAGDPGFVPVAILIGFVLGMSYVAQRGVIAQVAQYLAAPAM